MVDKSLVCIPRGVVCVVRRMCADVRETRLRIASPRVLDHEICPVKWMMTELMPEGMDLSSCSCE